MASHLHIAYNSSITQQKGPIPCWHTHWLRGGRWRETKRQKDCVVTNCGRKTGSLCVCACVCGCVCVCVCGCVCVWEWGLVWLVCVCVCMKCSKVNLMSRWAPQFLPSVLMSCYYCLLLWAQTDWDVTADIRYRAHTHTHRCTYSERHTQTHNPVGSEKNTLRWIRRRTHTQIHSMKDRHQECARGIEL